MKRSEAEALVAKLAGAFPRDWVGEATFAVYAERLERLPLAAAALEAIESLVDTEDRLPSVAKIRDEYRRYNYRHLPRALDEPPVSEEQRAENIRQMRALAGRVEEHLGRDADAPC